MAKFQSVEEYYVWCETMVTRIYYANIAMNHDAIRDTVSTIASVLHVNEGSQLIAHPDDEDFRVR